MCRDTRIIDSVSSFSVPHIIIHEVPDQAPWEACENRAVAPQHCDYLTVPGTPCFCVPSPDVAHAETLPTLIVEETLSFTGRHEPSLPEEIEFAEVGTEEDLGMLSPVDESDSDMPDTPEEDVFRFTIVDSRGPSAMPVLESCTKFSHTFVLEDDEDDLPPFDEWYQDIARRTR
jgi:hypothetical protein